MHFQEGKGEQELGVMQKKTRDLHGVRNKAQSNLSSVKGPEVSLKCCSGFELAFHSHVAISVLCCSQSGNTLQKIGHDLALQFPGRELVLKGYP